MLENTLILNAALSVTEARELLGRSGEVNYVAVRRTRGGEVSWFAMKRSTILWLLEDRPPEETVNAALQLDQTAASVVYQGRAEDAPADFDGVIVDGVRVQVKTGTVESNSFRSTPLPPAAPPPAMKLQDDTLEEFTEVPVYFGTDRAPTGSPEPRRFFGGERGDLQYGVVHVSIPHDHRMGQLEGPRRWLLQREDPARHVVLLRLSVFDRAQFTAELKAAIGHTTAREALLFVHGYNVSFEDAARRTAQICYDLQFEGAAALYSWPSEGATLRYLVDENNVRWTVPHFTDFLRMMMTETGSARVHVIAHSMGNRAVAECLRGFDFNALPPESAQLRHIVFAAPDIDADTFRDLTREFRSFANPGTRFTLYASSRDKALKASQALSKYPRAGESGDGMVIAEGIDTIDASNVDTTLMGHSYIGDNQSILADVFDLVTRGDPPEKRFRLRPKKRAGLRYWLFAP